MAPQELRIGMCWQKNHILYSCKEKKQHFVYACMLKIDISGVSLGFDKKQKLK